MNTIELGLGLLSIGRPWGVRNVPPPPEADALALLKVACDEGIRFFDTAPAYGTSERLLGIFLNQNPFLRGALTIATKMGEVWDAFTGLSRVSHTVDDLTGNIDASLRLLGSIDILQVHKSTRDTVVSNGVMKALDYAESRGIKEFGASISDLETARLACRSGRYRYLQFPFNVDNVHLLPVFEEASAHNVKIIVNRPLAMGKIAADTKAISEAYRFITRQKFDGIILSGTSSQTHLRENIAAFKANALV